MAQREAKWTAYIPNDGNWPINYEGDDQKGARAVLRTVLQLKRLPADTLVFLTSEMK